MKQALIILFGILFVCVARSGVAEQYPIGDEAQVLLDGYRIGSFTQMHQVYPSRIVARAGQVREFNRRPLDLDKVSYQFEGERYSLDDHFKRSTTTGFLVIQHGDIVYETYKLGKNELDIFTSWSMAKSVVSTLFGLAQQDGAIQSSNDLTTKYVPELKDSAYKDNKLVDLLQMSSGVEFIEDYVDTNSLEATAWFAGVVNRQLPYNKTILWFDKRIAEAGTTYYYASLEPQVIGWVVSSAIEESLSSYLSAKIWQKIGAEQNAYWMLDRPGGMEISSCCISASLRDYGRLGQLFLNNGKVSDEQVLPESWIDLATRPDPAKPYLHPGEHSTRRNQMGYQHYWWLWNGEDRAYSAIGFGGQTIYVNPAKKIVIVQTAAWGAEGSDQRWQETHAVIQAIVDEIG